MSTAQPWRKTSQHLIPVHHEPTAAGQYDLYPGFPIGPGKIGLGFDGLAAQLRGQRQVVIDGYVGIFWADLRAQLDAALQRRGVSPVWVDVGGARQPQAAVEQMVAPYLGGDDPIFGTRFPGQMEDFFDPQELAALRPDPAAGMSILYGWGAALAGWDGTLIYVDLPKNEIQFRARAGTVANLGAEQPASSKAMYKRFYFVDWPALNRHKAELMAGIDWMMDGQRPDQPTWMAGDDLRAGLDRMGRNFFRVRPWFEPGAWGGHWIKEHIPQLPQDVPNYAWSFELIVPENGLLFESDSRLLEVSFDCLMFHNHQAVLGDCAARFGYEFPIRFDLLDTFGGGSLSLQCHPRPEYIRQHFGENFTQDETYYILDCRPNAQVYLGFREDIEPDAFRATLEHSHRTGTPVDVEHFVNVEQAHKHDLFLIPSGTIHCSGVDNLVLEISATPYIFTFKMYDWMRVDLDGKPRPINIERAFDNLRFERKGQRVQEELVAQPTVIDQGEGWQVVHLPTHDEHFYDVHRFEFTHSVSAHTGDSCHVLNLVEGESLLLETPQGMTQRFNYAETFVVPAAADSYRLINQGDRPAKVIKAFVKPGFSG